MFGQLSNRVSIRDLVFATQEYANKAFHHLGFGKHASKSTLADANRDYHIFEAFTYVETDNQFFQDNVSFQIL